MCCNFLRDCTSGAASDGENFNGSLIFSLTGALKISLFGWINFFGSGVGTFWIGCAGAEVTVLPGSIGGVLVPLESMGGYLVLSGVDGVG